VALAVRAVNSDSINGQTAVDRCTSGTRCSSDLSHTVYYTNSQI